MIEYTIEKQDRLIWVWMGGDNTYDDLASHYARVLKDPRYERSFDCIFHLDAETDGPIMRRLPEVRTLIELLSQCQDTTKWAVVAPMGFKRTILEFVLKGVSLRFVTMRFFDHQSDALGWLNNGRKTPITPIGRDRAQHNGASQQLTSLRE